MSYTVDRDLRRIEVAEAAYQLVAEQGMDMLTVRAVAKAMDCSTTVVSHYFSSKHDLLAAVFRFASERNFARWEAVEAAGGDLCTCCNAVLPIDKEMKGYWRVYLSFWSMAMSDAKLGPIHSEMLNHAKMNVCRLLAENAFLSKCKQKKLQSLSRQIVALMAGIASQACISEEYWPADRQTYDLKKGIESLLGIGQC